MELRKAPPPGFTDMRSEHEHMTEMTYPYRQWLAVIAKCKDPRARKYMPGTYLDERIYKYFKQFYWDIGPPPDDKHIAWMKDITKGFRIGNLCWIMPSAIKAQRREYNRQHHRRMKEMLEDVRLRIQNQAVSAPEGRTEGGVE